MAQPQEYSSGLEISITDEECEKWSSPWRNALVVKVLGKRVSFRTLGQH